MAIRVAALPEYFEHRYAEELARGIPDGRALLTAFLDAATIPLSDWEPRPGDDDSDRVTCEVGTNRQLVGLHLMRDLPHYQEDGDWSFTTFFNVAVGIRCS